MNLNAVAECNSVIKSLYDVYSMATSDMDVTMPSIEAVNDMETFMSRFCEIDIEDVNLPRIETDPVDGIITLTWTKRDNYLHFDFTGRGNVVMRVRNITLDTNEISHYNIENIETIIALDIFKKFYTISNKPVNLEVLENDTVFIVRRYYEESDPCVEVMVLLGNDPMISLSQREVFSFRDTVKDLFDSIHDVW